MNSSRDVDKLLDRGGAVIAWLFLFYLTAVLWEQWLNDDHSMFSSPTMFIVMVCISTLVLVLLTLVTRYLYRDIVRTIRSIWWKQR